MNKDNKRPPILIFPKNAKLPENHQLNVIESDDLITAISKSRDEDVPAMGLTARELQAIVEYPDVFQVDLIMIDHLTGGDYNAIWYSFASGLESVTEELLAPLVTEIRNDPLVGVDQKGKFDTTFDKAAVKAAKRVAAFTGQADDDDSEQVGAQI